MYTEYVIITTLPRPLMDLPSINTKKEPKRDKIRRSSHSTDSGDTLYLGCLSISQELFNFRQVRKEASTGGSTVQILRHPTL